MISLKIDDVKSFMAKLLTNTLFDEFVLKEMEIQTFTSFNVTGQFHESFFSKDELEERGSSAVFWRDIRAIALAIIRGNKTPLSMKIVFQLPKGDYGKFSESLGVKFNLEEVAGLFLNIRFEKNELRIITGTAMKIFTLDKTIDQEWDTWVKKFLHSQSIYFEEE